MFSARIPLKNLIEFCRVLRHNLGAGLTIVQVMRQQADRGTSAVRPVAQRIHDRLKQGAQVAAAFEKDSDAFPPLFMSLLRVGEETGHLAEIFGEMEKFFILQDRLRKQFRSQSILPVIQFVFAIFIIAGLILVLGLISDSRGGTPIRIFGLSGPGGAITFLSFTFGLIASIFLAVKILRQNLSSVARVDTFLLRVPVLGPCLEAFALNRLAMCLQITLDSGMPIMQGVALSLEASGNAAYSSKKKEVLAALKRGRSLHEALCQIPALSRDFLQMLAMGEEGGRVPEMMRHQAEYFQEEAARRLTALTRAASGLLWLVYAGFMIYAIFTIASVYLSALGV